MSKIWRDVQFAVQCLSGKWYWSHNPICVHTAQSEHCLCFQLLAITRCCVPVTSLCAATHHPITPSHYIDDIAFCYSLLLCFYCWLCFQKSVSNMLSVSYYFETADRRSSKSNLFVIVRGKVALLILFPAQISHLAPTCVNMNRTYDAI